MTPDKIFDRCIPEPNSGCWLWAQRCNKDGYGQLGDELAHRVSFEAHKGAIRAGNVIRHSCDQPSCVNPDHLLEGTQAENILDRVARKRGADHKGERSPVAKLTTLQVRDIRADLRPVRRVAMDYGISSSHVTRLRLRRRWQHVI